MLYLDFKATEKTVKLMGNEDCGVICFRKKIIPPEMCEEFYTI
jgi:hypothetical protein